jgi:hypothetical protein
LTAQYRSLFSTQKYYRRGSPAAAPLSLFSLSRSRFSVSWFLVFWFVVVPLLALFHETPLSLYFFLVLLFLILPFYVLALLITVKKR